MNEFELIAKNLNVAFSSSTIALIFASVVALFFAGYFKNDLYFVWAGIYLIASLSLYIYNSRRINALTREAWDRQERANKDY